MEDIRYDGNYNIKIQKVGFVSVSRNANYTFEYKEGKERYSFIYIKNGELKYHFKKDKKRIRLTKGEFLFIPKNIPYKATYLKDNTYIKIIVFDIDASQIPSYLNVPFTQRTAHIKNIFDSITNENIFSPLYLTSKIYEIFFYIQNDVSKIPQKYKNILPAINEIKQKYMQNNKLSYYAEMCSMSESNFRKVFKEYTGSSLIEYRNNIRLLEVQKMIDSGEFSISEAAYLAGFNNMSFFYKLLNRFNKQ